ncbi:MAG: hypothetical protein KAG66_06295 [Methylococcales bacterium]|nr:hypothetical protein [Methylococcales bacterium]
MARAFYFFTLVLVGHFVVSGDLCAAEKTVDFNRDIRPILSNKCFQCHGPDEEGLKADLRLDVRTSAIGKSHSTGLSPAPNPVKSYT